ncbi:hypothetical protein VTK73DRAFT_36 [Phialemonium thermophilum]|uniref:Myb-like DNA-binding domain-containing protein n=1 Tax=Phialemonium thermophilum TaxID=223376 RepID=A0ABR3Y7S9_9PEZI
MSSPIKYEGSSPGGEFPQPSVQEAYFFLSILKNQISKPDVDWDKVAAECNFKNAETARVRFGQVKRKLGIVNQAGPPKASPTSRKRATAVKEENIDGDAEGTGATQSAKKKPRKRAAAGATQVDQEKTKTPTTPIKAPSVTGPASTATSCGVATKPDVSTRTLHHPVETATASQAARIEFGDYTNYTSTEGFHLHPPVMNRHEANRLSASVFSADPAGFGTQGDHAAIGMRYDSDADI